jgi:2',3'-cyclic-nucleotide 2'-phosphodiesterase
MRILFIGDIFGKPGREAVDEWLLDYRRQEAVNFVIANSENAAGGKGLTKSIAQELFKNGVDVLTGGNHSFQHREIYDVYNQDNRLLRPANLPPGVPGRGLGFYELPGTGKRVAVINLQGRAFMKPIDCPYRKADELVNEAAQITPIIIVDFHAEATSEKTAMAAYLDGRVTAVIGTHTHVPTADARISEAGTAAITDVGMTGPFDSVIGVETAIVLEQLIHGLPVRHEVARGRGRICALRLDVADDNGKATVIEQIIDPGWSRKR